MTTSHNEVENKTRRHPHETLINLVSGAAAGAISRTVTAPTDRIKTLLQTGQGVPLRPPGLTKSEWRQRYAFLRHKPDGIIQAAILIYKEGGWQGFWRGNGMNVLKVIPDEALKFAIKRHVTSKLSGDPDRATLLQHMIAGGLSGAITQCVVYPMEVVKTRMTIATNGEWKSIFDCISYTGRKGLGEFYKGFVPTIAGIVPFQGTYFGLFFYLTSEYEMAHPNTPTPPSVQFIYSLAASSLAVFISYPLNLVRTKLQIQGVKGRPILYKGTIDCIKQTIRHENVWGLYRGLLANYLKALPSLSISLVLVKTFSDNLRKMY